MTFRGFSQPHLLPLCEIVCIQLVHDYRELLQLFIVVLNLLQFNDVCDYLMMTVSFQKMFSVCNSVVDSI